MQVRLRRTRPLELQTGTRRTKAQDREQEQVAQEREGREMNRAVKEYLASIGQKGGQSTSDAKTAAARKNGALGGRPKKSLSK
jgi:general stress protein YciG